MRPLSWTEFTPDLGEFHEFQHFESAGGGRVLQSLYRGPDVPIRLIMTADGVSWSELPLPEGFHVADLASDARTSIDIAGDRWVAFGWDVTRDPHDNVGRDIWFSDDLGSNWTEATVETPAGSEPRPPHAVEEPAVLEALARDDRLVVARREESLRERQDTVIKIYAGDGPSLPMTAEFRRWAYQVTGVASPDGIVLATQGDWEALLTSADGLAWAEQPLRSVELWATGGDGALWAAARTRKGMRIDRIRYQDGQVTVELAKGVKNLSSFAAGSAGVVAAGLTGRSAREQPALMRTRVRKAGRVYTQSGHGDYRADELRLGWSRRGDAWAWQPASEAFGVDPRRRVSVRLAVGKDFVLAEVSDYGVRLKILRDAYVSFDPGAADGWHAAAVPRRWFIARVS